MIQAERSPREEALYEALHDVQDAEFEVDVVDMGLIYGVHHDADSRKVLVDMTFTSMACPAMDFMSDDVEERLMHEPDVDEVEVRVVWDPPWTHDRLTPAGARGLADWGVIKWV